MKSRIARRRKLIGSRTHATKSVRNKDELERRMEEKPQFSKQNFDECAREILTSLSSSSPKARNRNSLRTATLPRTRNAESGMMDRSGVACGVARTDKVEDTPLRETGCGEHSMCGACLEQVFRLALTDASKYHPQCCGAESSVLCLDDFEQYLPSELVFD
ncbi:hypothetical protein BU16DRAFT_554081 [Lophium mytilinum]|uniref:Zinc finger C3HC4 RING-type domain-containing protein n=1 Tax=Lophium mytilinum TaxID=390894 RepID=A0A6A6RB34_9PEZI|nr:hypothetical protein BU16DRAFT_554081 [Lophium mytilinum]